MIRWTAVCSGAIPMQRRPILMKGDSHHVAPNDVFIVSGFYDAVWRPLEPWRDSCGDALSDNGWVPTHWVYLDEVEQEVR